MIEQKINVDQLSIDTIRTLSIDAIENVGSGHPGMPMGAAPMAYTLWAKFMNYNPSNPNWFNRDRFILSAGHGSMLLYSLLHLTGYDLSLDDLKNFRQWGSKTPGHPEFGHTPGVDATTGPLGQGIAMAVGMAMAERHLASTYNRENLNVIDHYTYSICGDGDLMEGVSAEAASLAGHLKLGRLVVMYDSNDISLDGDLHMSFSESVANRFKSYGWQVLRVEDGNDVEAIAKALTEAKANEEQPTLIEVKTIIGYGSPNKGGKSDSHGSPLGPDELKLVKEQYNWKYEEEFYIPEEVKLYFKQLKEVSERKEQVWNELFAKYRETYPTLAEELRKSIKGELPESWDVDIPIYRIGEDKLATRTSSGEVLNVLAKNVPQLFGGSADLASSNKTLLKGEGNFSSADYSGRNIWFGVREFAMGAAVNGMALHGGVKVFGATFFVFSDYLRPAIRLAALMKLPVIYVFTHDSIAVGEDGPTHEPIEQLASLRAMPGVSTIRPAEGNETAAAWKLAVESKEEPTALVLTRQDLPTLTTLEKAYEGVKKGAYIISEAKNKAEGLLLASGSEVSLAVQAQKALEQEGIYVSVVSMPSWDRFEKQSNSYKESILPKNLKARLGIEMGSSQGWSRYVGDNGNVLAIDQFGASGNGDKLIQEYGFTVKNVISHFKKLL
ncbi:MAG TPA: transketolase [Ureibacillus sp.]|uniref:transketolase n=1 Tax=Priestia TaxID=2800373 RepID=UPI001E4BC304|nr:MULTISPECIES: transketolase [Priestia]MCE4092497.1 transketolase [Priestia megaterium]MED3821688.1 transketolase [Priestia aryabhattai]HWL23414.1 transketolase [Ureibacillus sp.]